ncbi:MAG TPA: serine/threonine-protein kinase [Polyangiaceae bacterium]|nr:serine/threonine-protein kinase [Polyangiaceae bacterium]
MDDGSQCLDAKDLQELVAGNLPPERLTFLGIHLRRCRGCRGVVAAAAQAQASSPAPSADPEAGPSRAVTLAYWLEQALSKEADAPEPVHAVTGELVPGTLLGGKYRLVSSIGRGGGGTVWRAEHVSWQAPVAIKIVTDEFERTEQSSARFLREVKLAAAIRSPHVAQVIDHGIDELTGNPFLVMELLEGETLEGRLKRVTRLGPSETLLVLTHVVRALHRAHRAGIVHRDLKPVQPVHRQQRRCASGQGPGLRSGQVELAASAGGRLDRARQRARHALLHEP